MGNVVKLFAEPERERLAAERDRQVKRIVEHFLDLAARGELLGIAICAMTREGTEDIRVGGVYRSSPALGVNIATRMSLKLLQQQDRE